MYKRVVPNKSGGKTWKRSRLISCATCISPLPITAIPTIGTDSVVYRCSLFVVPLDFHDLFRFLGRSKEDDVIPVVVQVQFSLSVLNAFNLNDLRWLAFMVLTVIPVLDSGTVRWPRSVVGPSFADPLEVVSDFKLPGGVGRVVAVFYHFAGTVRKQSL